MSNTPRDSQCVIAWEFIRSFHAQHGFSPSYPEIGQAMGLTSKSSIHRHIHHLVSDKLVVIHGSRGAIPVPQEEEK